jgi:O-antigen ligase
MRHSRPLPTGDKRVLCILVVHLCFLPWALGTMHAWSQITSLALAVLGFVAALWATPRRARSEELSVGSERPALTALPFAQPGPLGRLLRFPPFWLGLGLLLYIAVQAFNPSWRYTTNGSFWMLVPEPNISWLPTSVDTPFARFNVWRQFIIYASAWLTLCTVAIGLTRRRSFMLLLSVLAANGLVLVVIGFLARIGASPGRVLWLQEPFRGSTSFASFIYKNHAGAYLGLIAAVMVVLAARYRERSLREHARSSPALLGVLGALVMGFAVVFTYSRGAALLLGGYLAISAVVYIVYNLLTGTESSTPRVVTFTVTAMIGFVVAFVLIQVDFGRVMDRFERLANTERRDASISGRLNAQAAGRDMLSAVWPRGVGAGGFRYIFPQYIRRFSESYQGGRLFWEHVHNDYLQIPIEQGVVGTGLIVLAFAWGCWRVVRTAFWRRLPSLLLVLGLLQTLAHATIDFVFQNPAILTTWLVLALIAVRFNDRQID